MVNGIRPMRDNAEAIAFRGPELDDYLAVRSEKHRFGRAGTGSAGSETVRVVPANDEMQEEVRVTGM